MIRRKICKTCNCPKAMFFIVTMMVCFSSTSIVLAQGFDWQYSSRLPSSSPVLFIGGGATFNYGLNTADIYSLGADYRCGDYKSGTETGFSAKIASEYWQTGVLSLWGEAGYRNSTVKFSSTTEPEPFKNRGEIDSLTREFLMKTIFHSIVVEAGVKWRIAPTHLNFIFGIRAELLLKNTVEQTESIVTPVEFVSPVPYSYGNVSLTSFRSVYITPIVGIGYDMELGRGLYATPKITVGVPLMSRSSVISWKSWDFSAGIVILTHL